MRKQYLDNIRWAAALLVVVYHVFYLFNAAGVPGGVGSFTDTQYQDILLYAVYPWLMVLLFVVAGMSARYSLEKRSGREFLKDRTDKLFVPSTLGLFVLQWLVGWLNVSIGGGMEYMTGVPKPVLYLIFAVSGIGPLWFVQMLWLFSLALVIIRRLDKNDSFYAICGKAHPVLLVWLYFVLWGGAQVGNMPVLIFYRFGIYGTAFLIGYFVLSHEKMQEQLAKLYLPLTAVSLATAIVYAAHYFGQDYTSGHCLRSPFTNFFAWIMTLAVLGTFKARCDRETPFTRYMKRAGWGVYVLHYFFVLASCWGLKTYVPLPAAAIYILALIAALAGSAGCWEVFRRVPFVRFAVLGLRRKNQDMTCGG